jgi:hypothetical protein
VSGPACYRCGGELDGTPKALRHGRCANADACNMRGGSTFVRVALCEAAGIPIPAYGTRADSGELVDLLVVAPGRVHDDDAVPSMAEIVRRLARSRGSVHVASKAIAAARAALDAGKTSIAVRAEVDHARVLLEEAAIERAGLGGGALSDEEIKARDAAIEAHRRPL